MGVPARPNAGDDVFGGSVVDGFAIGFGGTAGKRPKRCIPLILGATFEARDRILEELCRAGVRDERGDCPDDM